MLGKLFKHDAKSIGRLMLPATLLVLGTSLLGSAALLGIKWVRSGVGDDWLNDYVQSTLTACLILVVIAAVLGLVAYCVFTAISVYGRYYKNFFTDEGYLTFTLPVKTHSLLFSKILGGALWFVISALVTIALAMLMIGVGTSPEGSLFNADVFSFIPGAFREIAEIYNSAVAGIWGTVILTVLTIVTEFLSSLLMVFLAITIGSTVAKKAKIAASVGFYFVINTGVQILGTILSTVLGIALMGKAYDTEFLGATSALWYAQTVLAASLAFYAVIAVVEFVIINTIIKKRLNLE